jgi:hypothetical protein
VNIQLKLSSTLAVIVISALGFALTDNAWALFAVVLILAITGERTDNQPPTPPVTGARTSSTGR